MGDQLQKGWADQKAQCGIPWTLKFHPHAYALVWPPLGVDPGDDGPEDTLP